MNIGFVTTDHKQNTAKMGYAEAAAISNFSHMCVKGEREKKASGILAHS